MVGSPPIRSSRLHIADGLRAFAIFLVVATHLPVNARFNTAPWGVWGVNCFFVLSGFLLARPFLQAILDPKRGRPSTRLFLERRFLRIYPLYAVAVLLSTVLAVAAGDGLPSWSNVVSHAFMLHGFMRTAVIDLDNGPLWTMPVDSEFYLALPLVAFGLSLVAARIADRRRRVGLVIATLVAVVVGAIAWRYAICLAVPGVYHDDELRAVFIANVLGMAPAFAIGVGLALAPLVGVRPPGPWVRSLVLAAAAILALLDPHVGYFAHGAARLTAWVVFGDLVAALSVGCTVFALQQPPRALDALLRSRAIVTAAALAYAVYLFHYPILLVVEHALRTRSGAAFSVAASALAVAATLAAAYPAHRFVERPFLELKDRKREPGREAPLSATLQA